MGQSRPQMIAGSVQENLGLIFQAAKGPRMNDPRPVALELRPEDVPRLGIFSAARFAGLLGKGRQDADLVGFHLLPRFPAGGQNGGPKRLSCHGQTLFGATGGLRVLSFASGNLAAGIFREIDPAVLQDGEKTSPK